MTTRGFKEGEARLIAQLIADMLDDPDDEVRIANVREQVQILTRAFPVYK